jgi:uncharacterized membrane protein
MTAVEHDVPHFQALIVPHRSLSRTGVRVLLGAIAALCCVIATVFVHLGAWPVGGFAGLELGLAVVLFRLHATAARASELVLLGENGLRIIRTDPHGARQETVLQPAWLTLSLQERPGRTPLLQLRSRAQTEEIGRWLGEAEKRDLAEALSAALHRWRHPSFDNPQLHRDGAQAD